MQRISCAEAAQRLGVEEAQVKELLFVHRDRLPAFDPYDLEELPADVVAGLSALLRSEKADPAKASSHTRHPARIFAVTSGKGGVGKTSVSVNLAIEFASRGLRTILIDVDLGLAPVTGP